MDVETGLDLFRDAMLAKFRLRAERWGERAISVAGDSLLSEPGQLQILRGHLDDEIDELRAAPYLDEEAREAVDVANSAFLIWWRHQP